MHLLACAVQTLLAWQTLKYIDCLPLVSVIQQALVLHAYERIAGCSSAAGVSMQFASCKLCSGSCCARKYLLTGFPRQSVAALLNKAVSPSQHVCLCNQPVGWSCNPRIAVLNTFPNSVHMCLFLTDTLHNIHLNFAI